MQSPTRVLTIADALFPRTAILRDATLVVAFSLITAACAQIAFYVGPVPITGQTFAVLLSGVLLGSRRGALSQLAYLAQGACGLPVFAAGHSGLPYMLGPTGGYLAGFVAAAFMVGLLAERGWDRQLWTMAAAMLAGNALLYMFGLLRLTAFVPSNSLLAVGLYPFIPGELLKMALAATTLPSAWKLLPRQQR